MTRPDTGFTRLLRPSYGLAIARAALILAVVLAASACSRDRRYPLVGQILAIDRERQEITVKHEDVKGFMPAMTMPFKVTDRRVLSERKAGDLIRATLVVTENSGRLEGVVRTGEAPLPADAPTTPVARPLEPGMAVADATFVDQTTRTRRFTDWRGKTLAVTFVYTRCPLPDYCPLMDRNFAAVQRKLEEDPRLAGRVHLVSVSFDPEYDSPEVLRAHAQKSGARPATWTWLTGERETIDTFAAQFGVSIIRGGRSSAEITHSLRTIVIDREGRVVKIFSGNDWKPEELLETLRSTDAR